MPAKRKPECPVTAWLMACVAKSEAKVTLDILISTDMLTESQKAFYQMISDDVSPKSRRGNKARKETATDDDEKVNDFEVEKASQAVADNNSLARS